MTAIRFAVRRRRFAVARARRGTPRWLQSSPRTVTAESIRAFQEAFGTEAGLRTSRLTARVVALRARENAKPGELPGESQEQSTHLVDRDVVFLPRPEAVSDPAAGPLPDLDYLGISDPCLDYPDELRWIREPDQALYLDPKDPDPARQRLASVEAETEGHRRSRARHHRQQAFLAALGLQEEWITSADSGDRELVIKKRRLDPRMGVPGVKRPTQQERALYASRGELPPFELPRTDEQKAADLRDQCVRAVRWHKGRWRGARERFERTSECGKKRVSVHCNACSHDHDVPDRCSCGRVCLACREDTRKHRIARFAVAQHRVLEHARKRQILRDGRHGYAWRERMVTLTLPQALADEIERESIGPAADVTVRIRIIFGAWRAFSNRLRKWCRAQEKKAPHGAKIVHYRSFEWTPGSDGHGHPHFHIWIFSPLLDNSLVEIWWRDSLARAGLEGRDVRRKDGTIEAFDSDSHYVRTNVRAGKSIETGAVNDGLRAEVAKGAIRLEGRNGRYIQRYIEGWSIVDVDRESGHRISAEVLARLYEALEGPRLVATSPRLLDPVPAGCQECGAIGWMRTQIVDPRQVKPKATKLHILTGLSPPFG